MSDGSAASSAGWEFDAVLADGGTVHIRPVARDDANEVKSFHERQSPESIYYRFFSPRPHLSDRDVDRLVSVDQSQRVAFVAWLGDRIIGMAGYDMWRARTEADVWFLVDDDEQGRGLATILLEYLAEAARQNGFTGLTAQVLPSNRRMLGVFHSAGFETASSFEDGVVEVRFSIEETAEMADRIEQREATAEARSVERLLNPASVALIGASRRPGSVGQALFRNLLDGGFTGTVYPVNANGEPIGGVRSYATIMEVPEVVDVAIVAVPAGGVLEVVEQCGRRRVGGLIVMSAGFGSFGRYGQTGERLIVERARLFGMRVIGPESLGVINTDPSVALHASVAATQITPGPVSLLAQSGTLGIAVLQHASRVGVGFSSFVDVGAKVDVSGNDLLQFWEQDDRTEVIALHLESFGNPRKFTRLARRIARTKPIVAVRTKRELEPIPRTPATSTQAARSRATGGRSGSRDRGMHWPGNATVEALLEQAGVIQAETPSELFGITRVLAHQGVPRGRRVAIISNSAGASNLTVEALALADLEPAVLGESSRALLSEAIPNAGSVVGPIDLTFAASANEYRTATQTAVVDPDVDAAIVIYAPALADGTPEVAQAIAAGARAGRASREAVAPNPDADADAVPVLAILLGQDVGEPARDGPVTVPVFEFPSEAVRALGKTCQYRDWLQRDPGRSAEPLAASTREGIESAVGAGLREAPRGCWLDRDQVAEVLDACGVDVLESLPAVDEEMAVVSAERLGFPVALKVPIAERRLGEDGGVLLDLRDGEEVRAAYRRLVDRHGDAVVDAVVQEMAPLGTEVRVSSHQHAGYGAVIGIGIGGPVGPADTHSPVRVLPLTDRDADDLIARSSVQRLLEAAPDALDRRARIEELLLSVAAAIDGVAELGTLVLDPVFITSDRALVADARIWVAPDEWEPAEQVRRLE